MADKWIVLKFGGTSVAGRSQWQTIAGLARDRRAQGYRVLLVCSAISGVTNMLEALADAPSDAALLRAILDRHAALGHELDVDEASWRPQALSLFEQALEVLKNHEHPRSRAQLLCLGEWLSTRIGCEFLARKQEISWVDARDALEVVTDPELSPARQWLSAGCSAGADAALQQHWGSLAPLVITQGFVGRTGDGDTALLGRGGSDTSAALLAGRLQAERLEIWTDVPGLFSADPRYQPAARLLVEVDYTEALEMAASGAKVIHPRCIRAAAATATPLQICDLNRPETQGTLISQHRVVSPGIKTITCQHGMAVLLLENLDARQQVGFLARVFEVFRQRGISIDLVATSETTTTVSINCAANHLAADDLDSLAEDLAAWCRVKIFRNCVCVNLVGRGARTALSRVSGVMRYFDDRPLLMVSQSANDLCLSLLVRDGDHEELLSGAHAALIPDGSDPAGVFGPSWRSLGEADV